MLLLLTATPTDTIILKLASQISGEIKIVNNNDLPKHNLTANDEPEDTQTQGKIPENHMFMNR